MSSNPERRRTRVEMVTMRPIPAAVGPRHDAVEIVGEIGKIEMAVAVDEHRDPTVQAAVGST